MNPFQKFIKKSSSIIFTFAIGLAILIGLGIGGVFYLKSTVDSQLNPPKKELIKRADKLADFSKIPKGYNVTKSLNVLGVNAVVAEHARTGQYLAIVDPGWAMDISKTDIQTGRLSQKLTDYALKAASPNIKLNNIEIMPKGSFNAFNQSIPYANIKIKLSGINSDKVYEGMIGIISNPKTNKNELVVSLNKNGTFSQKVAEKFFKSVKLQ